MPDLISNLKNELQLDPDGLYSGKTAKEIVNIINNPVKKTISVEVPDVPPPNPVPTKTVQQEIIKEAPVLRVINGVVGAPNLITEQDVIAAQQ